MSFIQYLRGSQPTDNTDTINTTDITDTTSFTEVAPTNEVMDESYDLVPEGTIDVLKAHHAREVNDLKAHQANEIDNLKCQQANEIEDLKTQHRHDLSVRESHIVNLHNDASKFEAKQAEAFRREKLLMKELELRGARILDLDTKVIHTEKQHNETLQRVAILKGSIAENVTKIVSLHKNLTLVEKQHSEIEANLQEQLEESDAHVDHLHKVVTDLGKRHNDALTAEKTLRGEIQARDVHIADLKNEIGDVEQLHGETLHRETALKDEIAKIKMTAARAAADYAARVKMFDCAKEELEKTHASDVGALKRETGELRAETQLLRSRLEQAGIAVANVRARIEAKIFAASSASSAAPSSACTAQAANQIPTAMPTLPAPIQATKTTPTTIPITARSYSQKEVDALHNKIHYLHEQLCHSNTNNSNLNRSVLIARNDMETMRSQMQKANDEKMVLFAAEQKAVCKLEKMEETVKVQWAKWGERAEGLISSVKTYVLQRLVFSFLILILALGHFVPPTCLYLAPVFSATLAVIPLAWWADGDHPPEAAAVAAA